jgi:hypothetical protein
MPEAGGAHGCRRRETHGAAGGGKRTGLPPTRQKASGIWGWGRRRGGMGAAADGVLGARPAVGGIERWQVGNETRRDCVAFFVRVGFQRKRALIGLAGCRLLIYNQF